MMYMGLNNKSMPATGPAGEGDYNLPYDRLPVPEVFESFCRSLIQLKEQNHHNVLSVSVKSTGGRGCVQLGGDIIVKITDNNNESVNDLYDCKGGATLSVSKYIKAVDKFIGSVKEWDFKLRSFNIISASFISAKVLNTISEQQERLRKFGILHEVYGREDIESWMKSVHSDNLIVEFFSKGYIERLRGEEGLWQIKNQGIWGKLKQNSWNNYRGEKENKESEPYSYINEYVNIVAYLPTPDRQSISCFIDLRHHDYNHLSVTLSQDFLLSYAFEGSATPPESECRPWLFKSNDNEFVCDLGNLRISLPYNSVKGICNAFDKLWFAYKEKIQQIGDLFCSYNFDDDGYCKNSVPIMKIPLWMWYRLHKFCTDFDYVENEGEWAIFNALHNRIMVFNTLNYNTFPSRYVSFRIVPPKRIDEFHIRESIILWEPPKSFSLIIQKPSDLAIRENVYADALTTHDWLTEFLLPTALDWYLNTKKVSFLTKIKPSYLFRDRNEERFDINLISSLYKKPSPTLLSTDYEMTVFSKLVADLQSFYHCGSDSIAFPRDEMLSLFNALLILINNTEFRYLGYICGCLNAYPSTYENLLSSINNLKKRINDYDKRTMLIDMIFRCFIACERDGKLVLNKHKISQINKLLSPFIDKMHDRNLLMKQKLKNGSY